MRQTGGEFVAMRGNEEGRGRLRGGESILILQALVGSYTRLHTLYTVTMLWIPDPYKKEFKYSRKLFLQALGNMI